LSLMPYSAASVRIDGRTSPGLIRPFEIADMNPVAS